MENKNTAEQNIKEYSEPIEKIGFIYVIFKTIKGLIFLLIFVPFITYMMLVNTLPVYIGVPVILFVIGIYIIASYQEIKATSGKNTPYQESINKNIVNTLDQYESKNKTC